ncbi:hypothetical protein L1887_52050 [Cichorium endivia]|nr:hypothetical protein L1887_52050 [Cichorium endivia]
MNGIANASGIVLTWPRCVFRRAECKMNELRYKYKTKSERVRAGLEHHGVVVVRVRVGEWGGVDVLARHGLDERLCTVAHGELHLVVEHLSGVDSQVEDLLEALDVQPCLERCERDLFRPRQYGDGEIWQVGLFCIGQVEQRGSRVDAARHGGDKVVHGNARIEQRERRRIDRGRQHAAVLLMHVHENVDLRARIQMRMHHRLERRLDRTREFDQPPVATVAPPPLHRPPRRKRHLDVERRPVVQHVAAAAGLARTEYGGRDRGETMCDLSRAIGSRVLGSTQLDGDGAQLVLLPSVHAEASGVEELHARLASGDQNRSRSARDRDGRRGGGVPDFTSAGGEGSAARNSRPSSDRPDPALDRGPDEPRAFSSTAPGSVLVSD